MSRTPRAPHRAPWLTLLASLLIAIPLAASAVAESPALAPYARLAAAPEGRGLLALARSAIESYWSRAPVQGGAAPDWPGPPAGVYVSMVGGGTTRACVGSPVPLGTLGETVRALAVEALRADPRRTPVRRGEVAGLRIVISFVHEGETVRDPMTIDPGREGLLVSSPRGAVAFLPGEARTVRWALGEARRIGVLGPDRGDASFRRLRVVTLSEPALPPAEEGSDDES